MRKNNFSCKLYKKYKEQRFRDVQEEIATLEKNVTENSIENLETKKHEL